MNKQYHPPVVEGQMRLSDAVAKLDSILREYGDMYVFYNDGRQSVPYGSSIAEVTITHELIGELPGKESRRCAVLARVAGKFPGCQPLTPECPSPSVE